jgi:hypothetical protein
VSSIFIVGVESEPCKREQLAQVGQRHRKYRLLAHQQRRAFRPAGSDIGKDQRLRKGAFRKRTRMRHQIGFDKATRGIIPVGECPNGNTPSDRRRALAPLPRGAPPVRIRPIVAALMAKSCRRFWPSSRSARGAPSLRSAAVARDEAACHKSGPTLRIRLEERIGPSSVRKLATIAQPPSVDQTYKMIMSICKAWLADVLARPPDHHASKFVALESLSTIQRRSCSLKNALMRLALCPGSSSDAYAKSVEMPMLGRYPDWEVQSASINIRE